MISIIMFKSYQPKQNYLGFNNMIHKSITGSITKYFYSTTSILRIQLISRFLVYHIKKLFYPGNYVLYQYLIIKI